jgi:antitoxin (DNA-binding transcriptional repressor) of toxin-antitoxin stability system
MAKVSAFEARTHFGELLDRVSLAYSLGGKRS